MVRIGKMQPGVYSEFYESIAVHFWTGCNGRLIHNYVHDGNIRIEEVPKLEGQVAEVLSLGQFRRVDVMLERLLFSI